jgi:hypothetical protein
MDNGHRCDIAVGAPLGSPQENRQHCFANFVLRRLQHSQYYQLLTDTSPAVQARQSSGQYESTTWTTGHDCTPPLAPLKNKKKKSKYKSCSFL